MRSKKARWGIALAVLIPLVASAAWALRIYGVRLARSALEYEVRQLGAELRIDSLQFALFPPRVTATDVGIWKGSKRWAGAERIVLHLAVMHSIWAGTWMADIEVRSPIVAVTNREGVWLHLLSQLRESNSTHSRSEAPFLPRRVQVSSGKVDIDWVGPSVSNTISDLSLDLRHHGMISSAFYFETSFQTVVTRTERRLDSTRITVNGSVWSSGASLESIALNGPFGSVRARLAADRGQIAGDVDASVDIAPVLALFPEAGTVSGQTRIKGQISGAADLPEASFDVEAHAVRIQGVDFSAQGHLGTRGFAWALTSVRGQMFGGQVEGSARGTMAQGMPYEAQARISQWVAGDLVRSFGAEIPLHGTLSGDTRLRGLLIGEDLRGDARFTLDHGSEHASGTAALSLRAHRLEVEGVLGGGKNDQIRTRFLVKNGEIGGDLHGGFERLGILGAFVGIPIEGAGSLRAALGGTVDRPSFGGEVELSKLELYGVDLGATRGPFSISRQGLRSTGIEVGAGQMSVAGLLAFTGRQQNQFAVSLRAADLVRMRALLADHSWPRVEGRLDGTVRVEGPWRALRLSAQTSATAIKLVGEDLGDGKLEASVDGDRWQAALTTIRGDRGSLSIRFARDPAGTLTGAAALSGWPLERVGWVRERWPHLSGGIEGSGTLRGTARRPGLDASVRLTHLAAGGREVGDCSLQIHSSGNEVVVQAEAFGSVSASATIIVGDAYPFRARFDTRDLDLSPLLPKLSSGVSARLTASGELAGDRRVLLRQGGASIRALRVQQEGRSLGNRAPIELRVAEGRVDLVEAEMEGDGQRLRVKGHWADDAAELRVSAKADLALIESFSEKIASARGAVEAEVQATRRGAEPWRYRGYMKIEDGAVDLDLLIGVTQISGAIEFEDRGLDVREATGKLGGGEFLVSGSVSLDRGWDLGWALREASLEVPSWLDYRASGNGRLVGELSRPTFQGEIEIDQALYDQPIEWAEFLPWFRKQARSAPGKRPLPVAVDLHVVADGGLFVDNNLAKAEMRGDLRILGDSDALAWSGSLGVLNGEFVFRRRRFAISSGTIGFRRERPTDPDLQFHGDTYVSTRDADYEIQVDVSGTADRPRIVFTADDPSLTENDVLALVTFGRTVSQLQSQGASIELGEVLKVTAGSEGGIVEKSIYSFVPVDRIEIEPSFSRGTGASEPRLSIAKDLTDRFSAVIGAGVGSEKNQDVGLEYRVTRGLSLQTAWQSQTKSQAGALAGNLKVRVPFRTIRSFSLLPGSVLGWP